MLGASVKTNKRKTKMWVVDLLLEEGSVHEWNRSCDRAGSEDSIQVTDFIVKVNGRSDVLEMMEQLRRPDYNELLLVLCRLVDCDRSSAFYVDL